MTSQKREAMQQGIDRRQFLEVGFKTAAVLPVVSVLLAGCGGGEEATAPAAPAASTSPSAPGKAPSPVPAPVAAQPEAAPAAAGGDGQLVTEIAAVASMVTGLQYVNESAKPDQDCAGCQLYTATSDGRGKCQLFAQGLVSEKGWCASWVAKVS